VITFRSRGRVVALRCTKYTIKCDLCGLTESVEYPTTSTPEMKKQFLEYVERMGWIVTGTGKNVRTVCEDCSKC